MGEYPQQFGSTPWIPVAASSYAEDVDKLFWALTALTVLFTVLVFAVGIGLALYYKRGNKVDRSRPVGHNTLLELSWSLPPLLLGLGVFFWSAKVYTQVYTVPKNAKEIFVIGKQWMWHMQHANGIRENNELHVPVGEPVKIVMISQDVIHAFYVPEFRMQRMTQPGQYTTFWFTPTRVGKYHLYCNMYCGTQHSEMGGWVYVQSRGDYQKWVASASQPVATGGYESKTGALTAGQRGAALYEKYQCASCHSQEAVQRGRGPSLVGLFGKTRQLSNGKKVVADDGYLRNVLYYPQDYPLAGWPQGMPSYKGSLSEEDVLQVNAYVKTLSAAKPEPGGPQQQGSGVGVPNSAKPEQNNGGASDHEGARAANTDNQQWRYMYGGER